MFPVGVRMSSAMILVFIVSGLLGHVFKSGDIRVSEQIGQVLIDSNGFETMCLCTITESERNCAQGNHKRNLKIKKFRPIRGSERMVIRFVGWGLYGVIVVVCCLVLLFGWVSCCFLGVSVWVEEGSLPYW
jgi:hypothetical protein